MNKMKTLRFVIPDEKSHNLTVTHKGDQLRSLLGLQNILLANSRGFSVTEVVIAMVVVSLVLLAGTSATIWMQQNNQHMATATSSAASGGVGSAWFSQSFQAANIAVQFEHMPVQVGGCTTSGTFLSGPCTAQLINGLLQAVNLTGSDAPPSGWVEFFRDDDAALTLGLSPTGTERNVYPKLVNGQPSRAANALVMGTTPMSKTATDALAQQPNPVYVTWPLTDDTSQPLMVLGAASGANPLTYDAIVMGKSASSTPGADPSRYLLMEGTDQSASMIANNIYLVYNSFDPSQYIFQYSARVQDCALQGSQSQTTDSYECYQLANNSNYIPSANGTSCLLSRTDGHTILLTSDPDYQPALLYFFQNWSGTGTHGAYPMSCDTSHFYAVDMEPLSAGLNIGTSGQLLKNYYSTFPTGASYWSQVAGTSLITQLSNLYPFPTTIASFSDPGYVGAAGDDLEAFPNPNSGLDLQTWGHYYTGVFISSAEFVAVPVSIKSFALQKQAAMGTCVQGSGMVQASATNRKACTLYNLVATSINKVGTAATGSGLPTVTVPNPQVNALLSGLPLKVGALGSPTTAQTQVGQVVLGRQMGTENFQMMYFKPGNLTVSQ